MNLNIFSDLRKPGLVPGESLSLSTNIDSVLEKNPNLHYVKQNEKSSYAYKNFNYMKFLYKTLTVHNHYTNNLNTHSNKSINTYFIIIYSF